MSGCRIGKVRYKSAPHLAQIIPLVRGAEYIGDMHRFVDTISEFYQDVGLAGMAVVAWGFNGEFSRGVRMHRDSGIRQTMLPSMVADILRRDTMQDVIYDNFGD